jgi:hypothetical protein
MSVNDKEILSFVALLFIDYINLKHGTGFTLILNMVVDLQLQWRTWSPWTICVQGVAFA